MSRFIKGRSGESASMTPPSDLPPVKGKGLTLKNVGGLAAIATGLVACGYVVSTLATATQANTATPELTPTPLLPTATPNQHPFPPLLPG